MLFLLSKKEISMTAKLLLAVNEPQSEENQNCKFP